MTLRPEIHNIKAKTVVLLGAGNVASHLVKAIRQTEGYRLVYHYIRSLGMKLEDIPRQADLYIFAIKDSALPDIWRNMPETKGVWLHTAGSVALEDMAQFHEDCGVLYPLQTFSKGQSLSWHEVPIYYEGHKEAKALAEALSPLNYYADSVGRTKLHLAAVLACNYSNYLISLAENYLQSEGFEPKALLPLLRETFRKLESIPAKEAQTGPARRGDLSTIERHLSLLPEGQLRDIYKMLASAILSDRIE